MTLKHFTAERLAARVAERPAGYLAELEACVSKRDASGIWVDIDSPAWKAMRARYALARMGLTNPLPREKWPLSVRLISKLAKDEDRGVGDTVARLAGAVGGEQFKTMYRKITGQDCGCGARAERLNEQYPYERPIILPG